MNVIPPESSRLATATSWIALLACLACLCFLAWFIPDDRRTYIRLFQAFRLDLPHSTFLMIRIPDMAIRVAAGVLAVAAIGVQWLTRSKNGATVFHLMLIVICCVTLTAYRESLAQPMTALIRGILEAPGGR